PTSVTRAPALKPAARSVVVVLSSRGPTQTWPALGVGELPLVVKQIVAPWTSQVSVRANGPEYKPLFLLNSSEESLLGWFVGWWQHVALVGMVMAAILTTH